ncbi:MAG: DUF4344 domain-containing metallopeptidase [Pseudomonadota bacterium]
MRRLIFAALLAASPALATDEEVEAIVLSNAENTLWHEAAHLLVTELELPVVGQEEDAADGFATLMMMEDESEDRVESLLDVAELWIVSHERDEAEGLEPAYYGEHDLDAQRGLRVICFLAGESPDRAGALLDAWGVPGDRAESCEFDFALALDSWDALLDPHLRGGAPGQSITIHYGTGGRWESLLRETEMLEYVAETLDARFVLPEGLVIEAISCDEPTAFWDPEERRAVLCYELMDDFALLAGIALETRE